MLVADVIGRIRGAVERGGLGSIVEPSAVLPLNVMGDLLRPWEEIFPGAQRPDPEGESPEDFRSNRRSMNWIRKPKFIPQPRRSCRPLPGPLPVTSAPKLVHPELFQAVSAVWDWYQSKDEADPQLLTHPFDFNGMHKFLDPLWHDLSDWYPLAVDLENIGSDGPVSELPGFCLRLPMWSYDDPGAGVVEGFLNGVSGVTWLMSHFLQKEQWDLPKQDMEIIGSVGWEELAKNYAAAQGKKTYDLNGLEDFEETFFKELKARFPRQYGGGVIIIDDGWGTEVWIKSKEDIEYALAFCEAFDRLSYSLPDPDAFENSPDASAEFAHELCNVWRRTHGKRQVKWPRPEKKERIAV